MVIQYNYLPFEFDLINNRGDEQKNYNNISFCDDIKDINDDLLKNSITINENSTVLIKFNSSKPFRLEMDGFDGSTLDSIKHDDGIYLTPSKNIIPVMRYDNFPLPPGRYIIKVYLEDKCYYTSYEVKSVRLDDVTWELMAKEVLESIKLLAFQMAVQKNLPSSKKYMEGMLGSLLLKMNIIEQQFNKVIAALDDISINPHSKISKKYILTNKSNSSRSDFKCNKLDVKKIRLSFCYEPVKYTDYQLTENAYMKRIIVNLDNIIRQFINEIRENRDYLNTKILNDKHGKEKNTAEYNRDLNNFNYIQKYYIKARKIKNIIDKVKDTTWFNLVNENILSKVASQSMFDPRYAILSKLSKDLKSQNIKYNINNTLSFIWHNSSKLYELWGVIKLVETFQKMGFALQKGFNVEKVGDELRIAGLSSGDYFLFTKGDLDVKISYDAIIPKEKGDASLDIDPVYTVGQHNKPDCKIDFYYKINDERHYISSLIIDFKYRTKKSLWKNTYTNSRHQLISYANDTRSLYIYGFDKKSSLSQRPVKSVWALYPDRYNVSEETVEEDLFIKLISFVPGYQDIIEQHIDEFLSTNVQKCIKLGKAMLYIS